MVATLVAAGPTVLAAPAAPARPARLDSADALAAAVRVATLYRVELELLEFERTIRTAHADAARAAVDVATLAGEYAGEAAAEGATK